MGTRVELSKGAWAEFTDPARVTTRQRRAIYAGTLPDMTPATRDANAALGAARQAKAEAEKAATARGVPLSDEDVALLDTAIKTAEEQARRVRTGADFVAMMSTYDDAIVVLLSAWSYTTATGEALPITKDALLDLPDSDFQLLRTAAEPYVETALQIDTDPDPDPASPTPPSNA